MAKIVSVADVHRKEEASGDGYPHTRRPLAGVKVYISPTGDQNQLIREILEIDRNALKTTFGPEWRYSHFGRVLIATYSTSDNPWDLTDTGEIAKKALELAKRRLDSLRRKQVKR